MLKRKCGTTMHMLAKAISWRVSLVAILLGMLVPPAASQWKSHSEASDQAKLAVVMVPGIERPSEQYFRGKSAIDWMMVIAKDSSAFSRFDGGSLSSYDVWTYDYHDEIIPDMSFSQIAERLVGDLGENVNFRSYEQIVLIAQGVGGNVVMAAYNLIRRSDRYEVLSGRIHGVFLLSTPRSATAAHNIERRHGAHQAQGSATIVRIYLDKQALEIDNISRQWHEHFVRKRQDAIPRIYCGYQAARDAIAPRSDTVGDCDENRAFGYSYYELVSAEEPAHLVHRWVRDRVALIRANVGVRTNPPRQSPTTISGRQQQPTPAPPYIVSSVTSATVFCKFYRFLPCSRRQR